MLKSLLGNDSRDRQLSEEMRTILHEMQEERARYQALVESGRDSADRMQRLGEPMAKTASDVDAMTERLGELEQRLADMSMLAAQFHTMNERSESLAQKHEEAEAQISSTLEEANRIRSLFEDLGQKVDIAVGLKDRLAEFLEVEKPFQQLRGEAEAIREQVDGTGEHLVRLREQHDRLVDAHKLAVTKMEALDRRRDDLGRELQDKERRVVAVEGAVRGMDGVQQTVDEVKREIGTVKALGDNVVRKAAALEAQREAVERALAEAEHLDRAMRQLDQGIRQQQENEKTLGALQEQVLALRSLHEAVVERSGEISQLQRETDEQTRGARQDLTAMTDEMKKTVERFDFESRGLESVSQRVADMRGSLTDFENRFKGLSESRQLAAELKVQTQAVASQLGALTDEVGHIDKEIGQLRAIRRDLDDTARMVREAAAQATRIEVARPAVEAALRDIEQLASAHALVREALERAQLAQEETARVQEIQSETRTWLESIGHSVVDLRDQVGELNLMAPTIEHAHKLSQRISDSMAAFESRRDSLDEMQRRMADLGALGETLDERGQKLQARMEAAEQQFGSLEGQAEEAERLSQTVGTVSSNLREAGRRADEIKKAVATITARCESVEALEERTKALKQELDQRQRTLAETAKDLQRSSELRQKAAGSAQKLGELDKKLTAHLETAGQRMMQVEEVSTQLEDRAANLQSVEKRLVQFEERLAKWDLVEQEVARSLEQIAARQDTVEALQADLDRMFTMAEQTATDVREITSAHHEIEQSRRLLTDVMGRLGEVRETASNLDERKRQMTKAEERLARAEALLVDVRSGLEALQGQKALVDQAIEKTGSLQFLLKQAETTIEGLREEREITTRVRGAVSIHEDEDDVEEHAKAA